MPPVPGRCTKTPRGKSRVVLWSILGTGLEEKQTGVWGGEEAQNGSLDRHIINDA